MLRNQQNNKRRELIRKILDEEKPQADKIQQEVAEIALNPIPTLEEAPKPKPAKGDKKTPDHPENLITIKKREEKLIEKQAVKAAKEKPITNADDYIDFLYSSRPSIKPSTLKPIKKPKS